MKQVYISLILEHERTPEEIKEFLRQIVLLGVQHKIKNIEVGPIPE